jgi:hypothetical protein
VLCFAADRDEHPSRSISFMTTSPLRRAFGSLGFVLLLAAGTARAERIEVAGKPVPLNPADPSQRKIGGLRYRGGLVLVHEPPSAGFPHAPRREGRVTFISDEALADGVLPRRARRPRGIVRAEMGRLDLNSQPEEKGRRTPVLALCPTDRWSWA